MLEGICSKATTMSDLGMSCLAAPTKGFSPSQKSFRTPEPLHLS